MAVRTNGARCLQRSTLHCSGPSLGCTSQVCVTVAAGCVCADDTTAAVLHKEEGQPPQFPLPSVPATEPASTAVLLRTAVLLSCTARLCLTFPPTKAVSLPLPALLATLCLGLSLHSPHVRCCRFVVVLLLLTGRCYEAEICAILILLRCSFYWYHFRPKSKFSDFGQKPWAIVHGFIFGS